MVLATFLPMPGVLGTGNLGAANECPQGTYGSVRALASSTCSGLCQGLLCVFVHDTHLCLSIAAGRYGATKQTTPSCTGPCAAGFFCINLMHVRITSACLRP